MGRAGPPSQGMFVSAAGTEAGWDRGQHDPARASAHPCGGPSARDGTAQPQGLGCRLPWRAGTPRSRAGDGLPQACTLVRPNPPSARGRVWPGPRSPSSPSAVVAATPNSASCGCGRWRAVRPGERAVGAAARHSRLAAPWACCCAGACAAPAFPSGPWCNPRARPSPAAADPGSPLHGRLGAAPTGQAGGRWRPRTAPCAAQHREKTGQGR